MSESPINQATLDELIQSTDSDFVKDLIDTFLDDTPKMLSEMRQALTTDDAETFRRAAHSLKSNSASFGAMRLSVQAKELEMLGKVGNLAEVGDRLTVMAAEFERVQVVLRNWQHGAK
jgi:HPt (histidine-containing phosphotransfer) domain-containing protein